MAVAFKIGILQFCLMRLLAAWRRVPRRLILGGLVGAACAWL